MKIIGSILLSVLLVTGAAAQTGSSQLTGTVTDVSGAAVAGAEITATEVDTGVSTRTVSNGLGYYTFPSLLPGSYRLQARKEGFQQLIRSGITLIVGQTTSVDLKLDVGQVMQSVMVSTKVPLLETSDSTLGGIADQHQITNMPLNGRDPYELVALLPGIQPQGGFSTPRVFEETSYESNFTTNGSPSMTNDTLIDGIPNMVGLHGQMAWTPSVEAVEEFRSLTSTYPAEYGRSGGGIISIVTKSGTNQFHGDAHEFLRNTVLDSNNYFNNDNGIARSPLVFNMFGGRIGGPIRRDRTFFFFSYEGQRLHQGQPFLSTVPTAAQRAGDFSQTMNGTGQLVTIYNPYSSQETSSGYTRTAFPGNKIPASMIDPVAQNVMNYYPAANLPGQGPSGVNNFSSVAPLVNGFGTWDGRIDQTLSDKDGLFVRFSYDKQTSLPANFFHNLATSDSQGPYTSPDYNVGVAETHTFGPQTMTEFRIGFTRNGEDRKSESDGMDLTTLGFPAAFNNTLQVRQFPTFTIASMAQLGPAAGANYRLASSLYYASGMVTRIQGRHNLRAGGEFREYLVNDFTASSPSFSLNAGFTQGPNPLVSSSDAGFGFASFLLGTPASGTVSTTVSTTLAYRYYAGYIQDDYRVSSKLTLNLGLRYDFQAPRTDRFNKLNWFDFNVLNPIGSQVGLPNLRGGLEFAGVNGNPRSMWDPSYDNFGPRFGFAYQLQAKTIIRGGFGIMFLPGGTQQIDPTTSNFGFGSTTSMVTTVNGVTPTNTLSNPFPQGQVAVVGISQGLLTGLGQSLKVLPRNLAASYIEMYNLNIQRELPGGILLEAAYVGTHALYIPRDASWDQLPDQDLSMGNALLQTVPNPFYGQVTNGVYSEPTIQQGYLLRPFPQFAGLTATAAAAYAVGNSHYNSFQLRVDRRFSQGLSIFGSYTNSKLLTDANGSNLSFAGDIDVGVQDYNNPRAERALSVMDISQRLVINYIYELPFGRGKRWLGNVRSPVARLVGGWRVAGITTFQAGYPLALSTSVNNTNSFGGGSRPNSNGKSAKFSGAQKTVNEWFNTAVFSQPAPFTFGNVEATLANVRSDGARNFDASLLKTTQISERFKLEFHADAFNVFNTPQFGLPGTSFGTTSFGVVSSQYNSPREIQVGLKLLF